jgi:hypothetical protein
MAKPKGAPKTGGRKAGIPNKATAEIKELAQQYAPAAIAELARLMKDGESEAARVSAIKEILDRAYGISPQALTGEGGGPIQHQVGVSWMTEEQAKARGWA